MVTAHDTVSVHVSFTYYSLTFFCQLSSQSRRHSIWHGLLGIVYLAQEENSQELIYKMLDFYKNAANDCDI